MLKLFWQKNNRRKKGIRAAVALFTVIMLLFPVISIQALADDEALDGVGAFGDDSLYSTEALKEIPVLITGMTITHNGNEVAPGNPIEFKNNDSFDMHFLWEVDYSGGYISIEDGDYCNGVQLWPAGSLPININYPLNGILRDAGGVTIGSFVLGAGGMDGKMDVTFNGNLQGQFDVAGTISVSTTINYIYVEDVVKDVGFYEDEFQYTFTFAGVNTTGVVIAKKNLEVSATGEMSWRIDVNTRLEAEPESKTVRDTLYDSLDGSGFADHKIIESSIKVYALIVNMGTGDVSLGDEQVSGVDYTCNVASDGKSMEVTFTDLSRKAYRIEYDTVRDPLYTGSGNTYQNNAALGNVTSEAQVINHVVPDSPENSKSGSLTGAGNETNVYGAYITWNIYVNSNGAKLVTTPATALIIVDTLGSGQQFRGNVSSVYKRRIDPTTGSTGSWSALGAGEYTLGDVSDTGFKVTINVPEDYYEYRVTYYADVTATQEEYVNEATIDRGDDVDGVVKRNNTNVGAWGPVLYKSSPGINTVDQTISWQVLYSSRNNTSSSINTIVDTWDLTAAPAGVSMNPTDVVITKVDKWTAGDWVVIGSADYHITPDTAGFTLTFSPTVTLAPYEQLRLAFTTKYTLPGPVNGQINDGKPITIENKATANGLEASAKRVIGGDGDVSLINAAKKGVYENGTFLWTIDYNTLYRDVGTGTISITDWWNEQQQQFIPDSFVLLVKEETDLVYEEAGASYIASGPTLLSSGGQTTMALALQNIETKAVRITYRTERIGGPVASYSNNARIGDGESFSASVSGVPITFLSKNVGLGSIGNTVNWSVTINEARYILENVVVVDVLGKGQILDVDSVEVVRLANTSNTVVATLSKDVDYTVEAFFDPVFESPTFGTTTLTITFAEDYEFDARHRVSYISTVDADTIEKDPSTGIYTVSNIVKLTGDKITEMEVTSQQANHWTVVNGTGSGTPAPVYVLKRDLSSKRPLEGAEFKLTDASGEHDIVWNVVTGADGMALVANLTAGEYRLVEVTAPDGYNLSNPNYQVFSITSADIQGLTFTFENRKKSSGGGGGDPPDPPGGGGEGDGDEGDDDDGGGDGGDGDEGDGDLGSDDDADADGDNDADSDADSDGDADGDSDVVEGPDMPTPTTDGNTLVADDDGWLELDENGVPLGRWSYDPEEEMWIFDPFPPLMGIPRTGEPIFPSYYFILLAFGMAGVVVALKLGGRLWIKLTR